MKIFVLFLMVALLIGCVTIQSNVKSGAVPEFRRILVVTKMYRPPRNYELQYLNIFPKEYEVCVVGITPLSFNPDSLVSAELKQCGSDVMLTIQLDQEGVINYSNAGGVVHNTSTPARYSAEMKLIATDKPFWKAILSGASVPPRTVVKRLIDDGVLDGKMPPPQTVIR